MKVDELVNGIKSKEIRNSSPAEYLISQEQLGAILTRLTLANELEDALGLCYAMLIDRDHMNSRIHDSETRLSPITIKAQAALDRWRKS